MSSSQVLPGEDVAAPPPQPHRRKKRSKVADVWSPKIASRGGFTQISNFFLDNYNRLQITSTEALFLIHLIRYKWGKDDLPYPSYGALARVMDLHHRRVRAIAKTLEERGLIKRIQRKHSGSKSDTNQYDLKPLLKRLDELADRTPK